MPELYFRVESDWEKVVKLREEISKLESQLKSMDVNKAPETVVALNRQITEAQFQLKGMVDEAAKAAVVIGSDLKNKIDKASQAVNDFNQKILNQKAFIKTIESNVSRLTTVYDNVNKNPLRASNALAELDGSRRGLDEEKSALLLLVQQQTNAQLSVRKLKDEYALYNAQVKVSKSSTFSLSDAFDVVGGVSTFKRLGSEIINVRGQFRSMEISLETMLGETKAKPLFSKIKQYAAISPIELGAVQSSAEMMVNSNVETGQIPRFIQAIGDISGGETEKFQSLSLAFSQTSAAGKLMEHDFNQMIDAGFNPLQIMSEETSKSIAQLKDEMSKGAISAEMVQQAFVDATSAGGKFYGMAQKQSQEVAGQMSMLSDAMNNKLNEIGESNEGVIKSGIEATTYLVNNYETIGRVVTGLVATYGTYRAALILNTVLEQGFNKAVWENVKATKAGVLVQAAYNKVLLMNPYVAVGAAVVALGIAFWTLADHTSVAEKAQRDYNKTKEEATKRDEDHRQKIGELLTSVRDESLATLIRQKSLDKLCKEYPKIFAQYDIEKLKLADIFNIKRQISEEDSKRNVFQRKDKYSSLKDEVNNQRRYLQLFDNPGLRKNMSDKDESIWKMFAGNQSYVQVREKMLMNEAKLKLLQKDVLDDNLAAYKSNLKNYSKEKLETELKMAQSEASKRNGFNVNGIMLKGANLDSVVASINGALSKKKSPTTYAQDLDKAKKEWEAAKEKLSKIEKDKDKFTSKQYEDAKEKSESAEKTYKDLGGVTGGELTKEVKKAEKLRKETDKYKKALLSKQAIEEKRTAEDLQMSVDEAHIKAMDEGSQKTIAQIELNFEKEMQTIDRQKEDVLRKKIEDARSAFEANPKNKDKSFDSSGISLSDKENKYFDELYKAGIANYDKAYDEYVNRYQSYTDQRIAIEKKFNDDIAILREARKRAQETGDKEEVDKIDRSIAKATTDKGKALMQNSFDVLKQSPDYIKAFEDLKNVSNETLFSLIEQFENAKNASSSLNPEDLREYTAFINRLMDELNGRDPFKVMIEKQKELSEARMELVNAKKQLDAVNSGIEIVSGVKSTRLDNGKIISENTYLTATEALEKYNKAKEKVTEIDENVQKSESKALEQVNDLSSAISNVGDSIGGTSGKILSLIGDVGTFTISLIKDVNKVTSAAATSMSAIEKTSAILAILQTTIQLMQAINSILPDSYNQYEKYAAKIKEIAKLTDLVNDYKIALLEADDAESNWFSKDNLKKLRGYKKLQNAVWDAYNDKLYESQAIYQNKSGGGWLTNYWNFALGSYYDTIFGTSIFGRDYDKGTTAAIKNLRIETRKAKKGIFGSGVGGRSQKTEDLQVWVNSNKDKFKGLDTTLFDSDGLINKELAKSIIDNYGEKLVGQTKETIEALLDLREKYDEYLEQLHEYVSSLYEPLVDNFVNSLWDWFDNGKDALDSFKDYASNTFRDIVSDMLKTIVLDKVVGTFKDDLSSIYDEYAKGNIDETELMEKVSELTKALVGNYEENIPTLEDVLNKVSGYLSNAGIDLHDSSSSSQSSTSKGYAVMSQYTGDELNGRFTALQIVGEELKLQSVEQTMSLQNLSEKAGEILTVSSDIKNIADDTRNILASTYLETVEIKENTGLAAKYLKDIKADITEVKNNTKGLS